MDNGADYQICFGSKGIPMQKFSGLTLAIWAMALVWPVSFSAQDKRGQSTEQLLEELEQRWLSFDTFG